MNNFSQETPSEIHEQNNVENESVKKLNLSYELLKGWKKETSQIDICHSS
jgi:hypothetical protein